MNTTIRDSASLMTTADIETRPQRRRLIAEACTEYDLTIEATTTKIETTAERVMRELQIDLSHMVQAGDISEQEANEWANMKSEQWKDGV